MVSGEPGRGDRGVGWRQEPRCSVLVFVLSHGLAKTLPGLVLVGARGGVCGDKPRPLCHSWAWCLLNRCRLAVGIAGRTGRGPRPSIPAACPWPGSLAVHPTSLAPAPSPAWTGPRQDGEGFASSAGQALGSHTGDIGAPACSVCVPPRLGAEGALACLGRRGLVLLKSQRAGPWSWSPPGLPT